MVITHVYLDMDGVLFDFARRFFELHGRTDLYGASRQWEAVGELGWDPVIAAGADFWADLPPTPWHARLLDMLLPARGYNRKWQLYIITDPLVFGMPDKCPNSAAAGAAVTGKLRCLHKHGLDHLPVIMTFHKCAVARPGAVLFDDYEGHAAEFHARGGHQVIVPQSYNCWRHVRGCNDVMRAIRLQFAAISKDRVLTPAGSIITAATWQHLQQPDLPIPEFPECYAHRISAT